MHAQLVKILPCLLLAAACGDNESLSDRIDAPPTGDAPVVGGADSRVWATGNILLQGGDMAGTASAFTDGATGLPFGPDNQPPIVLSNVLAFDSRGGKIAFGYTTLTVADADGSNPIEVFRITTPNVEITSAAISPDGTKVAFTMDSMQLNGGVDLYLAPVAAGATPRRVSPDRPPIVLNPVDHDVGGRLPEIPDLTFVQEWSADSKYLAFTGDLERDEVMQAWIVDTTAVDPTALALLPVSDIALTAPGIQGPLQFDSNNNVYFRARVELGTQFELFKVTPAGVRTVFALPRRMNDTVPNAGAFAITTDGKTIVFSADAPMNARFDLYKSPLESPAAVAITKLTGPGRAIETAMPAISADGTSIALVGNYITNGRNEPYIVKLDGSTERPVRLVDISKSCTGCPPASNADAVQWTADGRAVYVLGELATMSDTRVFRTDAAAVDQMPTLAVTTIAGGDVRHMLVRAVP